MRGKKKVPPPPPESEEANADPFTGTPGSHPVGVGVGAASGAAVGAVLGAAAGPAGAVAGTLVGAVAGALAGKGAAEAVKPTFPQTNAPHGHALGAGLGAASGGAAGAAIGSVAGPVGTLVGGVVGAVAGGLAGEGVAAAVNPSEEDEHWRTAYASRPYVAQGAPYEAYRPAYEFGWEARGRYVGRSFDVAEDELRTEWEEHRRGSSGLSWDEARAAVRDAWDRVDQRHPAPRRRL